MELRHLKLIDVVAQEGSLSKASGKLHLTQSALSHQLKEIEQELGIEMFHRINKRLVISDAGKIIRNASMKVQQEIINATKELDKLKYGSQGEIKLSTECYTCYYWLPKTLELMKDTCSQIDVHVLPEFTKSHFTGLKDMDLDLVITSLKADDSELSYKPLFQDEQLLIVSKDHPYSTQSYVSPKDFESQTLLIYNRPIEESTFYRTVLMPAGVSPEKFLEVRLTEAAIQLVRKNFGVKVMAKWAAAPYLANNDVVGVKIGPEGVYRKWYLAYNKTSGWKPHYDAFRQHLIGSLDSFLLNVV